MKREDDVPVIFIFIFIFMFMLVLLKTHFRCLGLRRFKCFPCAKTLFQVNAPFDVAYDPDDGIVLIVRARLSVCQF